jgi:hypothetical protein
MAEKKRCDVCNIEVSSSNWSKHIKSRKHLSFINVESQENYNSNKKITCRYCNETIPENKWLEHLKSESHKKKTKLFRENLKRKHKSIKIINKRKRHFNDLDFETDDYIVMKSEEALEKCFLTLQVTPKHDINNVDILIDEIPDLFNERKENFVGIKLQLVLNGNFVKKNRTTGAIEYKNNEPIPSKNRVILREDEVNDVIIQSLTEIKERIDNMNNNEAYFQLVKVNNVDFKLREYKPLFGSSYIDLPQWIKSKKATINIKNDDQKCFKYCMLYHKYKDQIKDNPERLYHYKKIEENETINKVSNYDFTNIKFPVDTEDVFKFCKQNNISINIYYVDKRNIIPYQTCARDEKKDDHINLLLIQDEENSHYVYIKNLSRLVRDQLTKNKNQHHICERCFYYSSSIKVFNRHITFCENYRKNEKALPILPKEEKNILKFKNIYKTIKVPLVYYADLEAVLRKIDTKNKIQKHEACSYGFLALSDFYKNFKVYTGNSANETTNNFIQSLIDEGKKLNEILLNRIEMFKLPNLNEEEEIKFQKANKCHFCNEEFDDEDIKVRDHCHLTGKFRGAAHQSCNLNVRTSLKIPIFFHNGSGYDFKHFIRKLYKIDKNIKILPHTEEKYISIKVKIEGTNIKFEFKDSMKFLLKSIEKSANVLFKKEGLNGFKNLLEYFKDENNEIKTLLTQKGVFPYSYLDSFDKLNYKEYPNYEDFYNNLKDENIEEVDYERGKKLWYHFKSKKSDYTLKDYLEMYLICDVLLLADCFESFRELSLKHYGLDPCHYVSSPGLSWDAMLKFTQVELELLTDADMLLMFMEGIRGGLSCIMRRYVRANNKYLVNYNENEEKIYLVPVDANNLYGHAMQFKLPYRGFKWCDEMELDYLFNNIMTLSNDSDIGYTLKVDLEYPKHLHDSHNDYSFFAVHKVIEYKDLSPYQKKLLDNKRKMRENEKDEDNKKEEKPEGLTKLTERSEEVLICKDVNYKSKKLITSLADKKGLVCDYRTLRQALEHGLVLKKIHCAIKYEQKDWLKPYIEKNTELRQASESELETDFFKLMNNAIYGKTIENVLKREDINFVTERKKALKYIKKTNFKRETIFSDHLVAIHLNKLQIKYNKPIYAGFCVLEMSKWVMYDFVYNYLKPKWGERVEIIQTDTDGLMLMVKTEDFYEDIKPDIDKWFDTSKFPENNIFGIKPMNGFKLGCFKIETIDNIVSEFIGLRSKMLNYLIETKVEDESKKTKIITKNKKSEKGVPFHISQKHEFELWRKVLNNETQSYANFNMIISKKLNVYTINQTKVALSNFDDKRYILEDGYSTLAHGHYLCDFQ